MVVTEASRGEYVNMWCYTSTEAQVDLKDRVAIDTYTYHQWTLCSVTHKSTLSFCVNSNII